MSKRDKTPSPAQLLLEDLFASPTSMKASYERALGKLVIVFSLLHGLLEHCSWKLWGLDPISGPVLTKNLSINHLAEKMGASIEHRMLQEKDRKTFKAILGRVKKAAERRNELIHSLWLIQDENPALCFSRKRGGHHHLSEPSVNEIDDFNSSIIKIAGDLIEFEKRKPLRSPVEVALETLPQDE